MSKDFDDHSSKPDFSHAAPEPVEQEKTPDSMAIKHPAPMLTPTGRLGDEAARENHYQQLSEEQERVNRANERLAAYRAEKSQEQGQALTPQDLASKRLAEFQAARDKGRAAGDFNRGADDQNQNKDQGRDEGRSR